MSPDHILKLVGWSGVKLVLLYDMLPDKKFPPSIMLRISVWWPKVTYKSQISDCLYFVFSFQSWFDFDTSGEDEVRERIIAQEREQHVLGTLHQVCTVYM